MDEHFFTGAADMTGKTDIPVRNVHRLKHPLAVDTERRIIASGHEGPVEMIGAEILFQRTGETRLFSIWTAVEKGLLFTN